MAYRSSCNFVHQLVLSNSSTSCLLSMTDLSKSLFLITYKCNMRLCEKPPKNKESRSQWNEKQASMLQLWLGIWEREKAQQRERQRERKKTRSGVPFFPNELTEATSISSNVMLKWKLIVQYAATAMDYASSISISGGVTKWVCLLGPMPRKADTSTNQPDFSIWHCFAAVIPGRVCFVCVSMSMRSNHTGDANGMGIFADEEIDAYE